MKFRKQLGVGTLVLVTAVYFFVYSAVRYNLAASAAALAGQPVTVVIDAGHGGEDGGATSVSGVSESQINLAIALRLEQVLALCGIETKMIRTEDTAVYTQGTTITEKKVSDLKQRVDMVNSVPNAVLVSIHQNHFSESSTMARRFFTPIQMAASIWRSRPSHFCARRWTPEICVRSKKQSRCI